MLSEGHPSARRYPLVVLWQEAQIARERIAVRMASETGLIYQAVATAMAEKPKEAVEKLNKTLEKLRHEH